MIRPLTELTPGDKGNIIIHHSQGAIRQRLLDLRLMPGIKIEFVRSAPLGDPIEIKVALTSVVIRAAETIMVRTQN